MSSNFKDKFNRYHTKRVTESTPYPTNNAYIYSFYAMMLGLYDNIPSHQLPTLPGLGEMYPGFHRHPDKPSVAISHDEYVGVAGMSHMRARKIVEEGEEHGYQFCDLMGFESVPFYKLNPILVIRNFYLLSKEKTEDGKSNTRKATVKYPYIWPVCFWHRPNVQYFYKRSCNRSPSALQCLAFLISSLFTIFSKNTKVMLGFKLIKLNIDGPNLLERFVTFVYKKRVDFVKEVDDYIDDKECPILIRVKEKYPTTNCII